jgi:hypothetical protein
MWAGKMGQARWLPTGILAAFVRKLHLFYRARAPRFSSEHC